MPRPKVIIVDDDANSRAVLCDVLGGEPYTLLEAADGQNALELVNREMPDLILLDVLMPGMDGLGVLHKLKEQEKTRSIPVIMITATKRQSCSASTMTGRTDRNLMGLVRHVGAENCLYKPLHIYDLLAELRRYIEIRPKLWDE